MRLVVDTNILISALLSGTSLPASLVGLWRQGFLDLLTAAEQIDELARVTRYPKIRQRIVPAQAGRLVNDLRELGTVLDRLPVVDISADPNDNYLLAIAVAGQADFLVTGDKRDLLTLTAFRRTRIVTVRDFLAMHGRPP